ncbi:MAG: hypothetical protein NUV77_09620 [Thermoguttaceae bacterium]|jgi:hypothetical protein|nr:hypothetical protein [Thermoguttaceae bacterium]
MAAHFERLAPVAIVAAMALWCSWPYLEETPSAAPSRSDEAAKLPAALLNPVLDPGTGRNPFQLAQSPPRGEQQAAKAAPVAKAGAAKPSIAAKPSTASTSSMNSKPSGAAKDNAPEKSLAERTARLTLAGTYVGAARSVAIINDKSWEPGDRLPLDGGQTARIAAITPSGVRLEFQGQSIELKYRNPEPGAGRRGVVAPTSASMEPAGSVAARLRLPLPSSTRTSGTTPSGSRSSKTTGSRDDRHRNRP